MEKCLKISIITPSYNQADFIEDNIRSVLNQNYPDFEHIIMDGGSTDNTVEILKKYPHLIWKSEKDRGQTHALNKALKLATGDIIGWLNSDDLYESGAFESVNIFFKNNRNKYIVTGNLLFIDNKNKLFKHLKAVQLSYNGLLNKGECVQQMSTFFRKAVFDDVGNFDENFNFSMDHEFWVRALKKYQHDTINVDLAKFRLHNNTKTHNSEIKFVKEIFRIKKKYNGKIFIFDNLRLLFMFVKEPFKKIFF